jgi:uncharacterized repeat protein (TIGR01451 family)
MGNVKQSTCCRTVPLTADVAPPAWLRYGVIGLATLILCSCSATQRHEARLAAPEESASEIVVRGQDPLPPAPPALSSWLPRGSRYGRPKLPTHLTPAQIQQASAPIAGCQIAPCPCGCNHAGCPATGPTPADELLCDGGDQGPHAGVRRDWQVEGVQPEDTIAHYNTVDGRTVVTPSNKVCIYAPRFGVVRQVIDPIAFMQSSMPVAADRTDEVTRIDEQLTTSAAMSQLEPSLHRRQLPPSRLADRRQAGGLERHRRAANTVGTLAAYANLKIIRTGEMLGTDRVDLARASLSAISWAGDQATQVMFDTRQAHAEVGVKAPGTVYHGVEPNAPRLRLVKLASQATAHPGEEIEFTLRFDNVGDREVGKVTIIDNLTPRLAYVDDSQECSVDAQFATDPNEGGSLVLRWAIADPIEPGEGGVIRFRCQVR